MAAEHRQPRSLSVAAIGLSNRLDSRRRIDFAPTQRVHRADFAPTRSLILALVARSESEDSDDCVPDGQATAVRKNSLPPKPQCSALPSFGQANRNQAA